jgi:hypothetical protein
MCNRFHLDTYSIPARRVALIFHNAVISAHPTRAVCCWRESGRRIEYRMPTISAPKSRTHRSKPLWSLSLYFIVTVLFFSTATLFLSIRRPPTSYHLSVKSSLEAGLLDFEMGGKKKSTIPTKLEGLSCQAYGGPSDEVAKEMVYWEHIPSDR